MWSSKGWRLFRARCSARKALISSDADSPFDAAATTSTRLHVDGRATMIHANDDDFFMHVLLEPAPMPAGKERISPEKVTQHDGEPNHSQQRGFLSSQAGGDPAMQQDTVE